MKLNIFLVRCFVIIIRIFLDCNNDVSLSKCLLNAFCECELEAVFFINKKSQFKLFTIVCIAESVSAADVFEPCIVEKLNSGIVI